MQEESIKEAIDLVVDVIYESNINVVDKTELLLNLHHFLTHYEQETRSKVYIKEKNERRNINAGNSTETS